VYRSLRELDLALVFYFPLLLAATAAFAGTVDNGSLQGAAFPALLIAWTADGLICAVLGIAVLSMTAKRFFMGRELLHALAAGGTGVLLGIPAVYALVELTYKLFYLASNSPD